MPDSNADEAREALLVKAAQAWVDDSALDSAALGGDPGDSVLCYLRAYYQRVVTEDLVSPSRLGHSMVARTCERLPLSLSWAPPMHLSGVV